MSFAALLSCPSRPASRGISVARVLGVDGKVGALRAICAGSTDAACYDILADDWEVEARAVRRLTGGGCRTWGWIPRSIR